MISTLSLRVVPRAPVAAAGGPQAANITVTATLGNINPLNNGDSVECECYALVVLDSIVKNRTYVYIVLVKVAAEEVSVLKRSRDCRLHRL